MLPIEQGGESKMEKVTIGADIRFTYLGHSGFMMISPEGKDRFD